MNNIIDNTVHSTLLGVYLFHQVEKQTNKQGRHMKLAKAIYTNTENGFKIQIDSCNKKVAKCTNIDTGEKVAFNRSKLEWMINNDVFVFVEMMEGW